ALAAAVLGGWDHGLDNRPFGVDQITWITKAAAVCCSKAVFRLPHRALPRSQIRESSAQQNHNRFTRFNNFPDWLLVPILFTLGPRPPFPSAYSHDRETR